jgi:hypothetical protein
VISLGMKDNTKNMNLGTGCSKEEKEVDIKLFNAYQDMFAWMYDYLKTYDTCVIQHTIHIKKDSKPFK